MAKQHRKARPSTPGDRDSTTESTAEMTADAMLSRVNEFVTNTLAPRAGLIVALVLAVVVIALGLRLHVQNQNTQLARAWQTVEGADSEVALTEIAQSQKGRMVGGMALFSLAKTAYEEGDFEGAVVHFDAFLKSYPASDLADDARLGRAYALEELENYDEAAVAFQDSGAEADTPMMRAQAYLGAGRCLAALDKDEKAREALENARAEADENSMLADAARYALQSLTDG